MIKKLTILILLAISVGAMAQQMPADKEARMEKFITELMSKMTLEEKIGQLHQISGGDVVSGEPVMEIKPHSKSVAEVSVQC